MMRLHLRSTLPDTADMLRKFHLEKGGAVQRKIDQTVIDYCKPYCPHDTGILERSPETASAIGSGKVIYDTPYAHYLYYGKVYINGPDAPQFTAEYDTTGNIIGWKSARKKYKTDRDLQYSQEKNALAGSFWFERMKADRKEDIIEEANRVARDQ